MSDVAQQVEALLNSASSPPDLTEQVKRLMAVPRYVDTKGAAGITGFSVKALEIMRVQKRGPKWYRPDGGIKVRYKVSELIEWMEARNG